MESITKNRQTPAVLAAMVDRAFGADQTADVLGEWAEELGNGWFNVAYRIRLCDGRRVVLKIAPPSNVEVMVHERGAMGVELDALALITEQAQVPVPRVLFADRTHDIVDADWFFMECIEGDDLGTLRSTLEPAQRDAFEAAIGCVNRTLNEIRGAGFGPISGPADASWRATFSRMIEDVLRGGEARSVDLGWTYDAVRAVVAEHAWVLDAVVEPRFVERDLWDSNVMVRGGQIVAIIDHERALFGDPLMEYGFVGSQLPAFGDSTAFIRGYGYDTFTQDEEIRVRLYGVLLVVTMIVETNFRGHSEPTQYDWARTRLDEAMALFGRRRRRRLPTIGPRRIARRVRRGFRSR